MVPSLTDRLRWSAPDFVSGDGAADRAVMARAAAYLYGAGAVLGFASLLLPHAAAVDVPVLTVLFAIAATVAIGLILGYEWLPSWAFPACVATGTVLITLIVGAGGGADSSYTFFYLWVVLYAFNFFGHVHATVHLAGVAAAYGIVVLGSRDADPVTGWLVTVGTLTVTAVLIALLRDRVDSLIVKLADAGRTDALTGLLNRRGFQALLTTELERGIRSDQPLSVLIADLDHFQRFNDRLGHQAGDAFLREVAGIVEATGRRIDTAARIGGEEFALVLPDTDAHGAYLVAERMRAAVAEGCMDPAEPLTASVGIAAFPAHGESMEAILSSAEQAIEAAKKLGANRTVIFSAEVRAIVSGDATRHEAQVEAQMATVLTLAETLDVRDTGTAAHSRAVGRFVATMATELGLAPERIQRVRLAGMLHDIGKIGVSDAILRKPGPLTDDEWAEMRKHPEIGARILANPSFDDIRSWVLCHHERMDGRGYPRALAGEEIPLEARILAVGDAYEAMIADRPYRPGMSPEAANEELRACAGTQFDYQVVEAFLRGMRRPAKRSRRRRATPAG